MNSDNVDILSALKTGDSSSYKELYENYYDAVERFVVKNTGTNDDAKDIFQDTMIVLMEKLRADNFELTASLKTYIIAISKNLWFKKLRNKRAHREIALLDTHTDQFYCDIATSIENEKSFWDKLQLYMTQITSHCNRLLHAMFFKNRNIDEIQKVYGYSSKHNAQNQKHKCIEQVRKLKEADEMVKK
jgi:RNA polymerase sigma factor (sigma-70 family)